MCYLNNQIVHKKIVGFPLFGHMKIWVEELEKDGLSSGWRLAGSRKRRQFDGQFKAKAQIDELKGSEMAGTL